MYLFWWTNSDTRQLASPSSCSFRFLLDLLKFIGGLIAGGVIGFFVARNYMKKYMKKNPPINEQMIKAMMTQMGRTPSQKQVNQMMKSMTKYMD